MTVKRRTRGGFTLIEMLVVLGIMVLISGLILMNNNRFGGVVLLQNLAYDVGLSIRQAQVYGIAVQRFNSSFESAYGMHFQVDAVSSGQSAYVLFADALAPENGYYDCPQPGTVNCELVQSTTIATGYRISQLCAKPVGLTARCDITSVDVTFRRPEPDAYIKSSQLEDVAIEWVEIYVESPQDLTKKVKVYVNGQISVE